MDLVIGEERFAARDRLDEWTLMKLAKTQASGQVMEQLAGMYDFINTIVRPEERERLDQFLSDTELPEGALNEAIGTLIQEYAGRPTERRSYSPDGSATTEPSSRADSSSPGTARVVNLSRKDGRSAAS